MCKVWAESLESSSKYFVYSKVIHLIEKELSFSFFAILVLFAFKESRETILMDLGFF